ncbi:MAG: 50S ribosomal protein L11 methyltransferase [Deltaproteobacteria bacterium]|nr:50S ribosomal protein L11 methyltransferase [Deltaproteobacteria bacterium]
MVSRRTLRLYWELGAGVEAPDGEDLAEENWTPYWRESLGIVRVTSAIVLVPAWEEVPRGVACAIRIDPGMAFGAGDHPTTRLCLRLLEELAQNEQLADRVLDVGTGTGVLALAAARLGAREACGLDIDPFGFAACRRNARLNGLETAVRPLLLSLDLLGERYPLVLANVVASQLTATAPHLREALAPGGRLILSGFGGDVEEKIVKAMGPTLQVAERREEEGWLALLLQLEGSAVQTQKEKT